jgi:hypothetical protein
MTATVEGAGTVRAAQSGRGGSWRPAQYLGLLGGLLVAYEVWTLVSWLASGPHVVTKGRVAFAFEWWWARGIEVFAVGTALTMLVLTVRDSRRSGRMTFDLKLWIALLLTSFWDSFTNIVQPIWFYSSDFVNLNEWWGHAPGFVSPAGGREPFPVFALVFLYPCFVLEARIAGRVWTAIRGRFPGISKVRLLLLGLVPSLLIGSLISWTFIFPHLWAGPGMGPMLVATDAYRWSIPEFLYVGVWSMTVCALRFFTDDRGETLAERGLDHLSTGGRNVVSTLAVTAWCSLAVIVFSGLVTVSGFFANPYPTGYPEHLPNVVCEIPGDPDTAGAEYGLCPGSPGFRIPLR